LSKQKDRIDNNRTYPKDSSYGDRRNLSETGSLQTSSWSIFLKLFVITQHSGKGVGHGSDYPWNSSVQDKKREFACANDHFLTQK